MTHVTLTVRITIEQRDELLRIAELESRTLSNLVRLALREFAEQYQTPEERTAA